MARTALLSLLPALLVATGWRQLEVAGHGGDLTIAAVLAVAVGLVPRHRLQLAALGVASLVVVELAFGLRPVREAYWDFWNGVVDFYEVTLPFEPSDHRRMHGLLILAVFTFVAGASVAISRRRAILAAAFTFAGAAWPVMLIRDAPTTARGALLLVTALLLLAVLRPGARPGAAQAALVGGAIVVAALVAAGSPSIAKGSFLNWERWEPYTRPAQPVDVSYVWDADYSGIDFPQKSTTVLTIKAPPRAPYWRATTLDVFVDDHWREDVRPIDPVPILDRDALLEDPLAPDDAWNTQEWTRQEVRVRALRGEHLVGATNPIAFEAGAAPLYSAGAAHVRRLRKDDRYEVWSYIKRPTPRQLARSRPDYPAEIAEDYAFLETPSGFSPPFGAPHREARMRELFADGLGDPSYRRLYDTALRVSGQPRNPYAAVIALEAWLRSGGRFTYDETPPARPGTPPLVAFVTGHRRGYCQQFAGAMALMLRYLGIPARVGAGFTTGRYNADRREYTVSDTNAHTWVEVWFAGYGWLPFDPTPGRGRLLSSYTASSTTFDVTGAASALAGVSAGALGVEALSQLGGDGATDDRVGGLDPGGSAVAPAGGDEGGSGFGLVAMALLAAVLLTFVLWAVKAARRRLRYVGADPRGLASAVRLELVELLLDQRVDVPAGVTPAELGAEIERWLGVPAHRISEAMAEARYAPANSAGPAAQRARRELRTLRRAIRRRLTVGERLRGLLSLRSLGAGAG